MSGAQLSVVVFHAKQGSLTCRAVANVVAGRVNTADGAHAVLVKAQQCWLAHLSEKERKKKHTPTNRIS